MTTAVFKIKLRELPTDPMLGLERRQENVLITAKNTDTLEEYATREFIEPDYLTKIQYWLDKRKFNCDETSMSTLHLNVD